MDLTEENRVPVKAFPAGSDTFSFLQIFFLGTWLWRLRKVDMRWGTWRQEDRSVAVAAPLLPRDLLHMVGGVRYRVGG